MRRQSLIALAVAIALGLVAVYLTNVFLTSASRQEDSSTVKVAVAAMPLSYGTNITPEKVRFVAYPASSLPPGVFTKSNDLLGKKRVALTNIAVNEPILGSKVSGPGTNVSIASLLPDGMRAAAVRIDDVSGVAGFVQPSDSVDVLVTRQIGSGGQGQTQQITDLLLRNVRVIAIDQVLDGEGKPTLAKTATLQVDPLGAQKLALAQEVGKLSLVLRKPGQQQDSGAASTVSLSSLRHNGFGGTPYYNAPPRLAVPVSGVTARPAQPLTQRPVARRTTTTATRTPAKRTPPQPPTSNVEVVRGTQGATYQVGDNHGL